jgi:hypothetical protein
MTYCVIKTTWDQSAWLSLRVKPVPIDSVALYIYYGWDDALAPYEVWLGRWHGDLELQCTLESSGEPSHYGVPALAWCHGATRPYVTVRKLTRGKRMFLSEVLVYGRQDTQACTGIMTGVLDAQEVRSPSPRGTVSEVVEGINARFERGRPSNDLAEAGVLVHIWDGYEDPLHRWRICDVRCPKKVDSFSSTLISRAAPWLFHNGAGGGFVISPEADIECAFPCDVGTGGHPWGRCRGASREKVGTGAGPKYTGHSLKDALDAQYDGSYGRLHPGVSGFNEVIVAWLFWSHNLPWAIEAFISIDRTDEPEMRRVHAAFLAFYGLSASEVPLLRYRCVLSSLPAIKSGEPCWQALSV